MKKIEDIASKKIVKIILFVIADLFILAFASFFALWIRFDFQTIPSEFLANYRICLFVDSLIMLVLFFILKLYTSVWRFASITELLNVVVGCVLLEILSYVYHFAQHISVPRSYFIIRCMVMVILVCGLRYSYRILRTLYIKTENKFKQKKTMIIGAGAAGRLLIDEMLNNQEHFESKIVCVIDDDENLRGTYFRGVPVCGNRDTIASNAEKYEVEEIIIAMPSAPKSEISKIVTECQKTKCVIKILPSLYATLNSNEKVANKVRPLFYEDFLGRNQIVVNNEEIINNIKDKVVLVTGGGGSIGSELCRQVAKAEPKTLIIFDIYENNAYSIQQELFRNYPNLDLHTIIGSVRDYDRFEKVFKEERPDIVFHAAAHKHVPLMEVSPNEAVKNNCLGTLNACKLADKYQIEKFVLVSTDKAVRPTNVMGASKRICEMIMQVYDKLSKDTTYVAVRFGNVLGSNGSVIPLFLKQIENGGPVTVTHKEMRRYFMTIPEAVSLILQASVYADGGEIFVLDMGEPVKIYDLARKLIRYKGLEPDVDIKIEITGLRPGEKLYEERLMDEEGLKKTPNELISIGQPLDIPLSFLDDLDALIEASYRNIDDIKEWVAKIVTTYKIDKERKGK
ncbi:MAG: nucleoside-diphosphate sugar epimerase/dehydratase [Erysipelotrichaceae bacterium]|nr:nucleoside-diphosphate sugar epimerase/dehydratase [Erysipelotrichaceae bacterium]